MVPNAKLQHAEHPCSLDTRDISRTPCVRTSRSHLPLRPLSRRAGCWPLHRKGRSISQEARGLFGNAQCTRDQRPTLGAVIRPRTICVGTEPLRELERYREVLFMAPVTNRRRSGTVSLRRQGGGSAGHALVLAREELMALALTGCLSVKIRSLLWWPRRSLQCLVMNIVFTSIEAPKYVRKSDFDKCAF